MSKGSNKDPGTLRTYRVGTFYHDDVRGKVLCYLRDFHPHWSGCRVYTVQAENGNEAKRKAKQLRLQDEYVTKDAER